MSTTLKMKQCLFCLLSIFAMLACQDESPEPSHPQKETEKSVFIFMPYTGSEYNLYQNFLQNIKDIQSVMTETELKRTQVSIFISKSATEAHLIQLSCTNGECTLDTLKRYTSPDFTSRHGIASILKDMKQNAPAKSYAMIVGCHGEGWLPVKKVSKAATRYYGGSTPEYQTDISTLAQAIADAQLHFEFLLFDDCYLSTIEVAYDLRDITQYLIASTSEIMSYGMPYHRIFPHLLGTPDYQAVCDEFYDFYLHYAHNGIPYPYGTLAVTNCQYLDRMAALMREINLTHSFDSDDLQDLQDLDAAQWDPTLYFDFGDYVGHLCANDVAIYNEFLEVMNLLVPYKTHTPFIFSFRERAVIPIHTFSGLSVSDPTIQPKALESKTETAWWKATHAE